MTNVSPWDPRIIAKLQEKKAPPNWSEQTGPFFHLQIPNETPQGPFHGIELKNFFDEFTFPEGTCVRDAKSIGEWQDIFSHAFFQRRKPQIVANEDIPKEIEEAYVLVEGQKQGPYPFNEVVALIEEKELLLTDQVSFDGGASWRKLYEYEEFDRRNHQQAPLPESPGWDVFKESNSEIKESLSNPNEQQQEEEAIAGLAFLENLKSGKTATIYDKTTDNSSHDMEEEEHFEEVPSLSAQTPIDIRPKSPKKVQYAYAFGVIFMLLGSFYFLTSSPKRPQRNISSNTKKAPMLEAETGTTNKANARGKRNAYRSPRLIPKMNPRTRRPASITTTDSFQRDDRRMDDSPYREEDPYYDDRKEEYYKDDYDYDRGDTPVEQDPVRAKLDKKTIDSQKNYYDEDQQQQFQAEYDTPYEDAPQIEPAEVWGDSEELRQPANEEGLYDEEALYQEEAY